LFLLLWSPFDYVRVRVETEIEDSVFEDCGELTSIVIPRH
jgi:hypothetical protein